MTAINGATDISPIFYQVPSCLYLAPDRNVFLVHLIDIPGRTQGHISSEIIPKHVQFLKANVRKLTLNLNRNRYFLFITRLFFTLYHSLQIVSLSSFSFFLYCCSLLFSSIFLFFSLLLSLLPFSLAFLFLFFLLSLFQLFLSPLIFFLAFSFYCNLSAAFFIFRICQLLYSLLSLTFFLS